MTAAPPRPPEARAEPCAQWDGVSVRYPYAGRDAVGPVSLDIAAGQRVLLLGPSGSGKSTLLQTLTGIIPQTNPADVRGHVRLGRAEAASRSPAQWADTVAQFFQDADQTLTGLRVCDEIAFGLENRGLPEAEIAARVDKVMARAALPQDWRERRTSTLSGGEKQLVALAATMVAGAPLFIADEPTANLSPQLARRVYDLVIAPSNEQTVLIVDHRLDAMIDAVDRVAVLDDQGALIASGPPGQLFRTHGDRLDQQGIWTPLASRFDRALGRIGLAPATPQPGIKGLCRYLDGLPAPARADARSAIGQAALPFLARQKRPPGAVAARLERAACAPLFGPTVLRDVTIAVHCGEVVGLVGPNGAGKSTLGASLAGLLRLKGGRRDGAPGAMAFQNPENQFLEASVRDELAAALPRGAPGGRIVQVLDQWSLGHVAGQHPFQLSQGQKRRLALACLTATDRWPLVVLDEPTAGLDARGVRTIADAVGALSKAGRALAVITHDMDFAFEVCDRIVIVADGGIVAEGPATTMLRKTALLGDAGLAAPAIVQLLDWQEKVSC